MSRIARKGFVYYRAETDRFFDIKIKRLRKEFSCQGYSVYDYFVNEIYRVEGCFMQYSTDEKQWLIQTLDFETYEQAPSEWMHKTTSSVEAA